MIAFRRDGDGFVARFDRNEVALLRTLTEQLTELLDPVAGTTADDPLPGLVVGGSESVPSDTALARLLPNAYADDDDASREFRQLTERGLANRKTGNARVVAQTLGSGGKVRIDADAAQAWMRTLTDLRLVIADRLGIDSEHLVVADNDEARSLAEVYDWLGFVQETLVNAVASWH
jgi:hypothetical protein